jgi:hypothetical protein
MEAPISATPAGLAAGKISMIAAFPAESMKSKRYHAFIAPKPTGGSGRYAASSVSAE